MITRVARGMAISCLVMAIIFGAWRGSVAAAAAVVGGGLLIAMSFWAIQRTVDDLVGYLGRAAAHGEGAKDHENPRKPAGFALVKFFTRHAIVAVAAYGMMVRLHLDPMGLLAGVSSLGVAVGLEALRDLRWRRFL